MTKFTKIITIAVSLFFIVSFAFAQQEENITFTTYYPSPMGSYRELRSQRMAIGDTYYNRATVCWDPPSCPMGSDDVSATNPSLLVEGNVGIGTTEPGSFFDSGGNQVTSLLLDIQPGTSQPGGIIVGSINRDGPGTTRRQGYFLRRKDHWNSYPSGLWKGSDTSGSEYWENLVINNNGGGANIVFMTNLVERMRIQPGGNVGIGTTAPKSWTKTEIITSGSTGLLAGYDAAGGVLVGYAGNSIQGRTGANQSINGDLLINPYGGNVGIGTTTPAQKLDVSGQIHATGDICTDAGGGKCLSSAGGGAGSAYFGGMYMQDWSSSTCYNVNPITGSCSCPSGFSSQIFKMIAMPAAAFIPVRMAFCYK